eukprot:13225174-Heterocapsa_arctica.AAC.1
MGGARRPAYQLSRAVLRYGVPVRGGGANDQTIDYAPITGTLASCNNNDPKTTITAMRNILLLNCSLFPTLLGETPISGHGLH